MVARDQGSEAGPASYEGDALPVNATLRRVAVIFRLLGWAWMLLLVVVTLLTDDGADPVVAIAAMILATVWTVVTLRVAGFHETLSRPSFVIADGVVGLVILSASAIAGAEHFFHGGYPMSWLGVAAYAWGFRGAAPGSLAFVIGQIVVDLFDRRGQAVPIAGSVTFFVFAVVAGWAFSALRDGDAARMRTSEALEREQELRVQEQRRRARYEERVELADRLHDSVLQTLVVLRRDAADAGQVRYLARRQERELRQTIEEYRSPHTSSLRAALLGESGEIEDLYRVDVDAVVRGDAETEDGFEGAVAATHEALANAAKHSGESTIDLYAELNGPCVSIFVRDKGVGFDKARVSPGRGLENSLLRRIEGAGGSVQINSSSGEGTEIAITIGECP